MYVRWKYRERRANDYRLTLAGFVERHQRCGERVPESARFQMRWDSAG